MASYCTNGVLQTIRCLLIQPNPESSLNEEAGKLLLEDYAAFERTARIMTKVHALKGEDVLKGEDSAQDKAASSETDGSSSIHQDNDEAHTTATESGKVAEGVLQPVVVEQSATSGAPSEDGALKKKKKTVPKKKTGLKRL